MSLRSIFEKWTKPNYTVPQLKDPKTLWKPDDKIWTPTLRIAHHIKGLVQDSLTLDIFRRNRRGRPYIQNTIRVGPNAVYAYITHDDGTLTLLGTSHNLLTNIGRDWWAQTWGATKTQNNPATATSATSLTGTGSTWTASNLATPQLGNAGMRVVASVTSVATAPVYGNIISNTTSVLTLDGWWVSSADTPGTTPASTNNFVIMPGGIAACRYMALTSDASAASTATTTLTGEITTNGGQRALATYAHTFGNNSLTLTKQYNIVTGNLTAIHRAGLFSALHTGGASGSDPCLYETVLNADATVVPGDTLTCTWTATLAST